MMTFAPQVFRSRLLKTEKVTSDATSFYFEKPRGFEYDPGQYIKMTLEIENPDERGSSRFFSLSSSPTEENLMITTRIIESSFKKKLASLPVGTEVALRGPHGSFVLDWEDRRPKAFLTGGIGITPFRSMFVYVHDKDIDIKITLLASFSTIQDIAFMEELTRISSEARRYVITITHPEEGNWKGQTGRIDENMIKKYLDNPLENMYYIAGPETLVKAMSELVASLGVAQEQVITEHFPGY